MSQSDVIPRDVFLFDLLPFLDVYSVSTLSVCDSHTHHLCDDDEGWRLRYLQRFGLIPPPLSWRWSFFHRARVRTDGVYLCRCMYHRRVRDVGNIHLTEAQRKEFNPSIVTIEYYRYLLFMEVGSRCLMLRSDLPAVEAVRALKECHRQLKENKDEDDEALMRQWSVNATDNVTRHITVGIWHFETDPPSTPPTMTSGCVQQQHKKKEEWDSGCLGVLRLNSLDRCGSTLMNTIDLELHGRSLRWRSFSYETVNGEVVKVPLDVRHFKPFTFFRIKQFAHLY